MIRPIFHDSKLIVFKDSDEEWLAFGTFQLSADAWGYLQKEAKKQTIFRLLTGQSEELSAHEVDACITRIINTPQFDYYYGNFLEADLEEVLRASDDFLSKQEDDTI